MIILKQICLLLRRIAVPQNRLGIGDDCERRSRPVQQVQQNLAVMDLATGDNKTPGAAMLIDYGVNLARAASS